MAEPLNDVTIQSLREGIRDARAGWDETNLGAPNVALPVGLLEQLLDDLIACRKMILLNGEEKMERVAADQKAKAFMRIPFRG